MVMTEDEYLSSPEYLTVKNDGLHRDLLGMEMSRNFWRWYSFWATIIIAGYILWSVS